MFTLTPGALAEGDIAAALARAGDIDGALALVRDIGKDNPGPFQVRPSEVPPALSEIARDQAEAGASSAAIETLRAAFSAAQETTQKDILYAERVRKVAEVQGEVGAIELAGVSASRPQPHGIESTQRRTRPGA